MDKTIEDSIQRFVDALPHEVLSPILATIEPTNTNFKIFVKAFSKSHDFPRTEICVSRTMCVFQILFILYAKRNACRGCLHTVTWSHRCQDGTDHKLSLREIALGGFLFSRTMAQSLDEDISNALTLVLSKVLRDATNILFPVEHEHAKQTNTDLKHRMYPDLNKIIDDLKQCRACRAVVCKFFS